MGVLSLYPPTKIQVSLLSSQRYRSATRCREHAVLPDYALAVRYPLHVGARHCRAFYEMVYNRKCVSLVA
jgi:hypothetical protein